MARIDVLIIMGGAAIVGFFTLDVGAALAAAILLLAVLSWSR